MIVERARHRLALITGSLDLGGTTIFLCNFGGELIRRAIPVRIFSFEHHHPLASDFQRLNIPVSVYDERRLIYEDRLSLILRELAHFKPTAVLANLSATSFEVLRYVPPGVFRIGTAQSNHPSSYELLQFYSGQVDLMAAVSKTITEKLQSMPEFARVQVNYLPLGVPIPDQAALPVRDFEKPLRLLYLGRLDREHKRAHLLADVSSHLRQRDVPFHLSIAGEGPERDRLETLMRNGPGQTVSFLGQVPYGDVASLLASHDIFLLVSDSEGLPLSLLEAMGYGLVPVVSDLPSGITELVDDTTGKRVSPRDLTGYADAIAWLHQHRDEMPGLSQAARKRVEQEFSVRAMADRWLKILPATPEIHPPWPAKWKIRPILAAPSPWRFLPPIRFVRRVLRHVR